MKQLLQDWLFTQAQQRSDAVAIVDRGVSATYGAVERTSNRLARALKDAGCVRGDRVALMVPKSARAITAMFATLKADCLYVPIDTRSPAARIERILEACECRIILAERSTAQLLEEIIKDRQLPQIPRVGWLDGGTELPVPLKAAFRANDLESFDDTGVESQNETADAAHILFTSGSTGAPKGVVITHSNVIHFVEWAVSHFGLSSDDRLSGHPPLHFDLSTFDIYGTVAAGAQIHLVPPELNLLPAQLAEFIREAQLTQWFSAPSALVPLAKNDLVHSNDFPKLRRLLWCGEKFPVPALIYLMRRLPHVDFVNLYGPTEATIASSFHHATAIPSDDTAEIPIGTPCGGESLYILDKHLRQTAPGETGDLYIGGVGLSPGYWRDAAKTNECFFKNPFTGEEGDRIYKTGDLARLGSDGLVYLLGRADSQIKVRGHRIELGDIEAALHATPGIQDAAVVAVDGPEEGEKVICCAYVAADTPDLPLLVLKKKLAKALPRYMIPTRWLALDSMPRNGNGKVDRAWLKTRFAQRTLRQPSKSVLTVRQSLLQKSEIRP